LSYSPRIRYLLLTAAVFAASLIQLFRGYRPLIVVLGGVAFLALGNGAIYLTGAKERAIKRQQARDYWAG
jgi:hypothetical protein